MDYEGLNESDKFQNNVFHESPTSQSPGLFPRHEDAITRVGCYALDLRQLRRALRVVAKPRSQFLFHIVNLSTFTTSIHTTQRLNPSSMVF